MITAPCIVHGEVHASTSTKRCRMGRPVVQLDRKEFVVTDEQQDRLPEVNEVPGLLADHPEPEYLLRKGSLAYLDTNVGLVPVKVVGIDYRSGQAVVKVTGDRRGYRHGEHIWVKASPTALVHRGQIRQRMGHQIIVGVTAYESDSGRLL